MISEFTLMSGAGNTFAICHDPQRSSLDPDFQKLKKEITHKTQAICQSSNVDGLVFLYDFQKSSPHYKWHFLNSDGSIAEMCGNAARCVASYTFENKLAPEKHTFLALSGIVESEVHNLNKVSVTLTAPTDYRENIRLKVPHDQSMKFVNTGVPHAVIKVNEINQSSLREWAPHVLNHDEFQPENCNVTFYKVIDSEYIEAVTFERGVNDFTAACGTGAVAAAFVHSEENSSQKIKVGMPGGTLSVELNEHQSILTGPVEKI